MSSAMFKIKKFITGCNASNYTYKKSKNIYVGLQ